MLSMLKTKKSISAPKEVETVKKESKKIKKPKQKWQEEFVLLKVDPPVKVPDLVAGKKSKKRYSVKITYLDKQRVTRVKTVKFGETSLKDFVDSNEDLKLKISRTSQLGHSLNDPFSKSFWRLNLMNNKPTISESYACVIKELDLLNEK